MLDEKGSLHGEALISFKCGLNGCQKTPSLTLFIRKSFIDEVSILQKWGTNRGVSGTGEIILIKN
ncbi:hypothetical protein AA106555_1814 [Neokomagataea thailandica NBRC 106555]|uniref:Uncharacterized protein n=1 Tax=Neokomagataea thailandica NBRC 106555 TaxID=1223520 RepID=A0ABQ0QS39_9PROT|nr:MULTISPECIES: hypothetical protein [Neokomagataea]GBR54766.1 hypothetical protein AA106555_1814 [Neokomagataea thailandica NBRC 106555]